MFHGIPILVSNIVYALAESLRSEIVCARYDSQRQVTPNISPAPFASTHYMGFFSTRQATPSAAAIN
jgi:hypothetical protein